VQNCSRRFQSAPTRIVRVCRKPYILADAIADAIVDCQDASCLCDRLRLDTPDNSLRRTPRVRHSSAAIVLGATSPVASDPAIRNLAERVPAVLIAARTESIDLPAVAAVFNRPVRIARKLSTASANYFSRPIQRGLSFESCDAPSM